MLALECEICGRVFEAKHRRKTGHYKQEGSIIELPESRAVASEVSINYQSLTVPLSLTTYR